jgi:DNA repair exonuclease SbcCD nuclease subunit
MSIVGRKFLHASDIHIGSPLGALGGTGHISEDQMKEVIEEMRSSFDNLIDTAISENVMFVVLAGDIYDGAQAQEAMQGHFQRGLERLDEHDIKVFIIHGNHDPLERQSKRRKPFPPNTKVFRPKDPEEFLAFEDDGEKIYVSGVSFETTSESNNLAVRFKDLPIEHARWRVGVLHTSLAGSSDHDPYAPCSVDDLRNAPVAYWALGHIHLRSDNNSLDKGRWWAYSGNLQGRSFKASECHPKGVLLVTATSDGYAQPEFVACDTVRFQTLSIPVSEDSDYEDLYGLIAEQALAAAALTDGQRLICRVVLSGRHADYKKIRSACNVDIDDSTSLLAGLMDSFSSDLGSTWVTDIRCEVLPVLDMNSFRQGDSMLAVALRRLDDMSDREVLEQCVGLLDAAPARILFPQNLTSDPDAPIDADLVTSIRNQVALALVETIRVEEAVK